VNNIVTAVLAGAGGSAGAATRNSTASTARCASAADPSAATRDDEPPRTGSQYLSVASGGDSILRRPNYGRS
jgi:hypothetical protein